ncbi:hypothetical protein [Streptomyces bacillaris]|uniref:hypothetical protein n=1 Tax=Streptomyces bacillaris TaxID=68179 RepID=UPI003634424A
MAKSKGPRRMHAVITVQLASDEHATAEARVVSGSYEIEPRAGATRQELFKAVQSKVREEAGLGDAPLAVLFWSLEPDELN